MGFWVPGELASHGMWGCFQSHIRQENVLKPIRVGHSVLVVRILRCTMDCGRICLSPTAKGGRLLSFILLVLPVELDFHL